MRSLIAVFLVGLLLAAPAAARELSGQCSIAIVGSSTLHDFDGRAQCDPFVVTVTEGPDGERHHGPVEVTVPVAGLSTGIKRRDRSMRKMFESERYPVITGRLPAAPLAERRRQLHALADRAAELSLTLQIRDITRPVKARISRLVDTLNAFEVDLAMVVSLAEFRLQPPTVLGFIRVDDAVQLTVKVRLAPLDEPWPH